MHTFSPLPANLNFFPFLFRHFHFLNYHNIFTPPFSFSKFSQYLHWRILQSISELRASGSVGYHIPEFTFSFTRYLCLLILHFYNQSKTSYLYISIAHFGWEIAAFKHLRGLPQFRHSFDELGQNIFDFWSNPKCQIWKIRTEIPLKRAKKMELFNGMSITRGTEIGQRRETLFD